MTLTGHWNRIEKRTLELWPRHVLEQEKQKWQERREHYRRKVDAYIMGGGSVNRRQVWAFGFIVQQSLTSIQEMLDTVDILEGKTAEPSQNLT